MERMVRVAWLPVLSLSACVCCGYRHVSDEELIRNFTDNESTFIKLEEMVRGETGFVVISPRLVTTTRYASIKDAHGGMSPARYAEYMEVFRALGLADGVVRSAQSVWFRAEARSWGNGSVTKGYFYSPGDPRFEAGQLVANLDSYVPQSTSESRRPGFCVLREIKPHWYLYKLSDG